MKKIALLLSVLMLLLCVAGCSESNELEAQPTDPLVTESVSDPLQIYTDAIQSYDSAYIELDVERQVQAGTETFSEDWEYTLQYKNLGTDDFSAMVTGTVDFDDIHSVELDERYKDGVVYGFLNDFGYHAESDAETFINRYAPVVLLDASIYETVMLEDENTIAFRGASALESWIYKEDYELIEAYGKARIDDDGALTGFTYNAEYAYGDAIISVKYKTKLSDSEVKVLAPDKHAAKTSVFDADIPLAVERAYGYCLMSDSFSVVKQDTVSSEALNAVYTEHSEINMHYGNELLFSIKGAVQNTDLEGNLISSETVDVVFQDGKLRASENGEEPLELTGYPSKLLNYIESVRSAYFPSLTDMDAFDASVTPDGLALYYTFQGTYETMLRTESARVLTGDINSLERMSRAYTPQTAEGYLFIDLHSGLPTAILINYSGYHNIEGEDRLVTMTLSQTIDATGTNAYTAIKGDPLPA